MKSRRRAVAIVEPVQLEQAEPLAGGDLPAILGNRVHHRFVGGKIADRSDDDAATEQTDALL